MHVSALSPPTESSQTEKSVGLYPDRHWTQYEHHAGVFGNDNLRPAHEGPHVSFTVDNFTGVPSGCSHAVMGDAEYLGPHTTPSLPAYSTMPGLNVRPMSHRIARPKKLQRQT